MQWTREGAHKVLQIRALMASDEWEEKWLEYVMPGLEKKGLRIRSFHANLIHSQCPLLPGHLNSRYSKTVEGE